ncbi:MAG: hypothetical protein ABI639_13845 [Thermoanaerobaculia bacterium]
MKRPRGTHLRRLPPDPAENSLQIDGTTFQWEIRHGWGTTADGTVRGISISVWSEKHQTRELILDFPYRRFGAKQPLPEDVTEALASVIPWAIAAGWVPDSRGRRFRLDVPEEVAE